MRTFAMVRRTIRSIRATRNRKVRKLPRNFDGSLWELWRVKSSTEDTTLWWSWQDRHLFIEVLVEFSVLQGFCIIRVPIPVCDEVEFVGDIVGNRLDDFRAKIDDITAGRRDQVKLRVLYNFVPRFVVLIRNRDILSKLFVKWNVGWFFNIGISGISKRLLAAKK
jgi:hypothetical protein